MIETHFSNVLDQLYIRISARLSCNLCLEREKLAWVGRCKRHLSSPREHMTINKLAQWKREDVSRIQLESDIVQTSSSSRLTSIDTTLLAHVQAKTPGSVPLESTSTTVKVLCQHLAKRAQVNLPLPVFAGPQYLVLD